MKRLGTQILEIYHYINICVRVCVFWPAVTSGKICCTAQAVLCLCGYAWFNQRDQMIAPAIPHCAARKLLAQNAAKNRRWSSTFRLTAYRRHYGSGICRICARGSTPCWTHAYGHDETPAKRPTILICPKNTAMLPRRQPCRPAGALLLHFLAHEQVTVLPKISVVLERTLPVPLTAQMLSAATCVINGCQRCYRDTADVRQPIWAHLNYHAPSFVAQDLYPHP